MVRTHDHEIVSIYPFSDTEIDQLMHASQECVLMWATKDGWPVGVTHAFVWDGGRIWLTFASHRHRAEAIRRDDRVSVNVSSAGYPAGSPASLPLGAITFKGRAQFHDDEKTRQAIDAQGWMHTGDLATLDAAGYCNIVGRIKDMVIRGGENIYPREI